MDNRGFSLVELSIVLVILGLLTGGILAGQSLIRAAELRGVSTEYSRYVVATQSFRDKYFAYAGDFKDATRYWGRLNSNADCATFSSATTVSSGVCDGNGDGSVSIASASQSAESFQFWRHLASAGLIEGTYSGIAGSGGGAHAVLGTNAPSSKLANSGWSVYTQNAYTSGSPDYFAGTYGNEYIFGGPTTNQWPITATLKAEELWNIDTKSDDGKPATGRIIAVYRSACTNSTSATDTASTYLLSATGAVCAINIINAF